MSEVALQSSAAKQAEYKRYSYELNKLKKENAEDYSKVLKKTKEITAQARDEQETAINNEKVMLQNKLADVKKNHDERVKGEMDKFNTELANLKKAHADQMAELKESQSKQVDDTQKSHQKYLAAAKLRFDQQKSKFES